MYVCYINLTESHKIIIKAKKLKELVPILGLPYQTIKHISAGTYKKEPKLVKPIQRILSQIQIKKEVEEPAPDLIAEPL